MRKIKKKMEVLELEMEDGTKKYAVDLMFAVKKYGIGKIKMYNEVTRTFSMTPDEFILAAKLEEENRDDVEADND